MLFGGMAVFLIFAGIFIITKSGISSLDNDAYSYIDEAQWVIKHRFNGELRPYTGNVPKPLLVLVYGTLYSLGTGFWGINLLCILTAGGIVGGMYLLGKRLHSPIAGGIAALLTLVKWPFWEGAVSANSSHFLLLFVVLALHLSLRNPLHPRRIGWICFCLAMGGLVRPEGWLIYLFAVCRFLWLGWRYRSKKIIHVSFALLFGVPLLGMVLDKVCWGDWYYSLHSFQYFVKTFLVPTSPPLTFRHLLKEYLLVLWRLGDSGVSTVITLLLAVIGWRSVRHLWHRRVIEKVVLPAMLLLLCFQFNTYRQGFFVPRFVIVPIIGAILLSGIGCSEVLIRLGRWLVEGVRHWSVGRTRFRIVSSVSALFVLGYLQLWIPLQTTYTEFQRKQRLDGYMAACVYAIDTYPKSSMRVLMTNSVYNPVRFHVQHKKGVVIDRMLEDINRQKSGDVLIQSYSILCLGNSSSRNEYILNAVQRDGDSWEARHTDIGISLYLYIRKEEKK